MATPTDDNEVPIDESSIRFRIKRTDGKEDVVTPDLWLLKLTCEECEEAFDIKPDKDRKLKGSPAFFVDLAKRFTSLGEFGIPACTPTVAALVWGATNDAFTNLKKNTSATPSLDSGTDSTPST